VLDVAYAQARPGSGPARACAMLNSAILYHL